MENTTKEAAKKYAEQNVTQVYKYQTLDGQRDDVEKDFIAGANWKEQQKLSQFEQMKTALEQIANAPYPYNEYERYSWISTASTLAKKTLAPLTETNEKP